ncbi:hypothetical protein MATL_G00100610 [Megalops atlanticus]|uniref:Uncharacterized protein n=1 Tax=Megalops atlanticus TaxID=7932 RepID=A0A9D3TDG4_MEGAT|nr:hypothetical protein MATL_G00100610 [Megalops atlanticus]
METSLEGSFSFSTTSGGIKKVCPRTRALFRFFYIRHEVQPSVWLDWMWNGCVVVVHSKGLPHCSVRAPHIRCDIHYMKPNRGCSFYDAEDDRSVYCPISGVTTEVVGHDLLPPCGDSCQHEDAGMCCSSSMSRQCDIPIEPPCARVQLHTWGDGHLIHSGLWLVPRWLLADWLLALHPPCPSQ